MPTKTGGPKLRQLVKLSQRKEALMAEIQNIDREMVRLEQQFRESREQKKGGKGKVTFSRESKKRRNVPSVRSSPRRKLAR